MVVLLLLFRIKTMPYLSVNKIFVKKRMEKIAK